MVTHLFLLTKFCAARKFPVPLPDPVDNTSYHHSFFFFSLSAASEPNNRKWKGRMTSMMLCIWEPSLCEHRRVGSSLFPGRLVTFSWREFYISVFGSFVRFSSWLCQLCVRRSFLLLSLLCHRNRQQEGKTSEGTCMANLKYHFSHFFCVENWVFVLHESLGAHSNHSPRST